MKSILIVIAVLTTLVLQTGCSTTSPVMAAAGGVYTVTKTGTTGFTPVGSLRKQAYKEANEFAASKGMVAEVVSVNETAAGFAKWPQVDLKFRLVRPGTEGVASDPTIAVSTQVAYDAEGRPTTGDTAVRVEKQVDVYAELKKLADLKERGVLTEEEFQSEKKKLLETKNRK
jgi:hypothetical protein